MDPVRRTPLTSPSTASCREPTTGRMFNNTAFQNTLPDMAFDTKSLVYNGLKLDRFVAYRPTSLEKNYQYEVHLGLDMDINLDLVMANEPEFRSGMECGSSPPEVELDPKDSAILEDREPVVERAQENRSVHHKKSVSWLRRTEYISTEETRNCQKNNEKPEAQVGFRIKKENMGKLSEGGLEHLEKDYQVKKIEKTFEDSRRPILKHPSNPNIHPVEVLPVLPDFQMWKHELSMVVFDKDPAEGVSTWAKSDIDKILSRSLIRGIHTDGQEYVGHFTPTDETMKLLSMEERGEAQPDDSSLVFELSKEYNFSVKNNAGQPQDHYYFLVRENGVFYNPLRKKIYLSRLRRPELQSRTILNVTRGDYGRADMEQMEKRDKELVPSYIEDDHRDEVKREIMEDDESQSKKNETLVPESTKMMTVSDIEDDDGIKPESGGSHRSGSSSSSSSGSSSSGSSSSDSSSDSSSSSSSDEEVEHHVAEQV